MGITENSANQATQPEMQGASPQDLGAVGVDPKAVTPRGADPILDRNRLGEVPVAPGSGPAAPDSDNGGSKEPRDMGNNGNPAQSAARPTAQQADANPAPLNEASEITREAV